MDIWLTWVLQDIDTSVFHFCGKVLVMEYRKVASLRSDQGPHWTDLIPASSKMDAPKVNLSAKLVAPLGLRI